MRSSKKKIYIFGCTMWDIVGKPAERISSGRDCPGIITERPGGVAFNVATGLSKTLNAKGFELNLVSVIGKNEKTEAICNSLGDNKIKTKNGNYIFGISNRLEQVIANLLDNSISFSQDNQKIEIGLEETSTNILMSVRDEGPGFSETSPQKIFKRFYSNRPKSFGKHSGLGLNIVKNIVQLHKGTVAASNRLNNRGAQVEVLLPKLL